MNAAGKRAILRWVHIVAAIPLLGSIYGEPSEVQEYVGAVRLLFVPVMILSGYWMYSGAYFAVLGVAVWLAAIYLSGSGAAILSSAALFIARKAWLMIRARRSK